MCYLFAMLGEVSSHDAKSCAAHPQCGGMPGDCCPNAQGVMLECCNAQCNRYPACLKQGIEGYCCPNQAGVELACCDEHEHMPGVAEDPKSCAAHAQCGGRPGDCCPNAQGIMLECCNAQCTRYPACQKEGIEGFCCPNMAGVRLACCDEVADDPKSCSAHSQCGGRQGDCCPNAQGVMLECCNAQCTRYPACQR